MSLSLLLFIRVKQWRIYIKYNNTDRCSKPITLPISRNYPYRSRESLLLQVYLPQPTTICTLYNMTGNEISFFITKLHAAVVAAGMFNTYPTAPLNVVFLGYVWPMLGGWCVVRVFISDVCIVLLCNLWVGISTHWTLPHHRIARLVSLHHRHISHLHTGIIMGFYFKNLIKYQTQSDNLATTFV